MGAEIKHFTLEQKDDNTYGWPWNEVIRKYLKTGYESENKQCELTIRDKKYQILRRDSITVFYDEKGDTLFDVTNDRLEKEYKSAISDVEENPENDGPVSPMGKAIEAIERGAFEAATSRGEKNMKDDDLVPMGTASLADIAKGLPAPTEEEIKRAEEENAKPLKQRAKEKLEKELNDAKDKNFADPVIKHLLKRCEEDDGLSSDVLQPHKTWQKCFAYIYEQARKQRDGNCAAVLDDVVYEWAEDYFHKDDKAEEDKKAKEAAEREKKQKADQQKRLDGMKKRAEKKAKAVEKDKAAQEAPKPEAKAEKPKKEPEKKETPKKRSNELEGQMDLFSMMGL